MNHMQFQGALAQMNEPPHAASSSHHPSGPNANGSQHKRPLRLRQRLGLAICLWGVLAAVMLLCNGLPAHS